MKKKDFPLIRVAILAGLIVLCLNEASSFFSGRLLSPGVVEAQDGTPLPLTPTHSEPLRIIRDRFPGFASVAVDSVRDEVVTTDENLFQILVYDRLDNTPPSAAMTEPKRVIGGTLTEVEFQCGVYVDPRSGDIYAVNNDTLDTLVVFSRDAEGNVPPGRELHTPHGTFGIAVAEEDQELYLTVQHGDAVVVYRKEASDDEPPLRLLQGDRTEMADPHGLALDEAKGWMFVANYGSTTSRTGEPRPGRKPNWPQGRGIPGSGKMVPPSITVYPQNASGNVPPLRKIQGPKTQLNWPTGVAVDPRRGEIFVANDPAHSILVFRETDAGDVSPLRVLEGPDTGLRNPVGVFFDAKNDELWVSNFGNHSLTVYEPTASGNVAPLRTIRSAPPGMEAPMIGNPGALAYDTKREEILVPN